MFTFIMITVFEKSGCPYCRRARDHLRKHSIPFKSIRCVDKHDLKKKIHKHGFRVPTILTFPRVYDGIKLVGGSDEVVKKFT